MVALFKSWLFKREENNMWSGNNLCHLKDKIYQLTIQCIFRDVSGIVFIYTILYKRHMKNHLGLKL